MSGGPAVFVCTATSGGVAVDRTGCPQAGKHQPHPAGYVQHSIWAERALTVATQATCEGCGRWEIWVPKHPDLRVALWPADCGWSKCRGESVGERRIGDGVWIAVCKRHAFLISDEGGSTWLTR